MIAESPNRREAMTRLTRMARVEGLNARPERTQGLAQADAPRRGPGSATSDADTEEVRTAEIRQALTRLKHHKAPGADRISSTMVKMCAKMVRVGDDDEQPHELQVWLAVLYTNMLRSRTAPADMLRGTVTMLAKPGKADYADPSAYRSITVLPVLHKALDVLLARRVTRLLEENHVLGEQQAGFRPGRATVDNLFVLAAVQNARRATRMEDGRIPAADVTAHHQSIGELNFQATPTSTGHSFIVLLDLQTAFDIVDWDVLFHRLEAVGVPDSITALYRHMYHGFRHTVRVGSASGDTIRVERGVAQGAVSSPPFFSVGIHAILPNVVASVLRPGEPFALDYSAKPTITRRDGSVTVKCGPIVVLLYADDIVITAPGRQVAQRVLDAVAWSLNAIGAQLNVGKSECLTMSTSSRPLLWRPGGSGGPGQPIKIVQEATYLGIRITASLTFQRHRRHALRKAAGALQRAAGGPKRYGIIAPRIARMGIEFAYSTLLYGAEVWAPSRATSMEPVYKEVAHAAARTLDVSTRTPRILLLGELGLVDPMHRIRAAVIAYWTILLIQPKHRYTRFAYEVDLRTYLHDQEVPTWSGRVHAMLATIATEEVDVPPHSDATGIQWLRAAWAGGDVAAQERGLRERLPDLPPRALMGDHDVYMSARRAVQKYVQSTMAALWTARWRYRVAASQRYALYRRLQPRPAMARHLDSGHNQKALRVRIQLRLGRYPLAALRAAQSHADDPDTVLCPHCDTGDAETVEHFLLHCPRLEPTRPRWLAVLRDVCAHAATLALLDAPAPECHLTVLMLALGGDLSDRDGMDGFNDPQSAMAHVRGPHPGRDRLSALRATAPHLVAMAKAHEALRIDQP